MFSELKVTQMAAYLLKLAGEQIPELKLLKLLYLVERQAMAKWGETMSGDQFVSMPHGPALAETFALVSGDSDGYWDKLIKREPHYDLALNEEIDLQQLDELSPAEMKILQQVFTEFGSLSCAEIKDYTHYHCREWKDPHGSICPIETKTMFLALGKTEIQAEKLSQKYRQQQELNLIKGLLK